MRADLPRRGRWRAALLAGAVLLAGTPLAASALAPHLTCGVTQTNRWERIPVPTFKFDNGIAASSRDSITSYAVDRARPQGVVVTNGYRVQVSESNGCAWSDDFALSPTPVSGQSFPGLTSSIVQVAMLNGRVLAAVQEGSGAASRPHIMVSTDGGTFRSSDNGLPAQGAPKLLRAAGDGRTAYLTVSPTASGGPTSGGLPGGLPIGGVTSGTPTGLLYRTTDDGASWTLQTGAGDLPNGGTSFTALDIDSSLTQNIYGIAGGTVVTSTDGGATFRQGPTGVTALTAMGPGTLAAFTSGGTGYISTSAGQSYQSFRAPTGITSAAFRSQSTYLVVESSGVLRTLEPGGPVSAIPAAVNATPGSLLGDRGDQSSYHALAGHALLRYVDPIPKGTITPPIATGDLSITPPNVGVVLPGVRNVSLPVGQSAQEQFTLDLPKNPTPLDLYFLVDVSTGMGDVINDVKTNIRSIVSSLVAAKVNLKVGVGILGTGPARGENPYPDTYAYPPVINQGDPTHSHPDPRHYKKPVLYKRIRAIGDTGPSLFQAINQLQLETTPNPTGLKDNSAGNHEGQLLALKNLAEGLGQRTQDEDRYHLPSISEIPPGQEAGFRSNPGVRRVVVLATNENFDEPYGTDHYADSAPREQSPHLNFGPTIQVLNRNHIQVMGLSAGETIAVPDLQTIARGTHMLTPPGGIACDGDQTLNAGDPIVCNNASQFSTVITKVLAALTDRQSVAVVPANRTPVLGTLDGHALTGLDVKRPNSAQFSVEVSCVDVKPATYTQDINAVLRQTVVGKTRINVTCVKAATSTPPKPVALGNPPPPPGAQPVANVAPPIVPPAPAVQPQVQPQVQVQTQIQPMTSGAIQEQQELQLALALNGTLKDDDPVFNPGAQMAMVDRRKREEVQALGVLAFAMTACAGIGLARLRARPDVQVRLAR